MKLLLDHCVDRHLAGLLPAHAVMTTAKMGWRELSNGLLLRAASSAGFQAFLTTDQNLRFQHDTATLPIPVVELNLRDTRLSAIKPLISALERALVLSARFNLVAVHPDGTVETLVERATPPGGRTEGMV